MAARRGKADDPTTRMAILDAAEKLMVEQGYAAVTSRRVAAGAGVNSALVYYYFETMDGLFVALFRRGADRSLERLEEVLSSPQPLWRFWDLIHDRSISARTMEFIALANHRPVIQREIAEYSRKFRARELELLSAVLRGYDLDVERWPTASIVLALSGISRFLLIEEAFGVDIGHAEMIDVIERELCVLEGPRPARSDVTRHTARSA
jgi:AcrR family transcriptional regulator